MLPSEVWIILALVGALVAVFVIEHYVRRCPVCWGSGRKYDTECHRCGGKGWLDNDEI